MKKIVLLILALLLLAAVAATMSYAFAKRGALQVLSEGAKVISTAVGPVEYRVLGAATAGRSAILYIPPGGYSAEPLFSDAYQVIIPSRPGYGGTPLDTGRTPVEQAQTYAALLDVLDIGSVIVMTVSAGGPSALAFAEHFPSRTRALVAVAPVSQSLVAEQLPSFLQSDFIFWALFGLMSLLGEETLAGALIPDSSNAMLVLQDPAARAALAQVPWSMWPVSVYLPGMHNDARTFMDFELDPTRIESPVLLIHGSADSKVPLHHSEELAQQISAARLVDVSGADHMVILSHMQVVNSQIGSFLRENGL